jgi:hypothetical protein
MKENIIREFLSGVNFRSEDWSLSDIKSRLRQYLGEEPGVDIHWKKDVLINELKGESTEVFAVEKVSVVFTETDGKLRKLEFSI